ncbi:MAG: hypothetical protein HQL74_14195 [Magnetococcales bacterium]|nr:hypothetical protein [Magnetococcales bacterium]
MADHSKTGSGGGKAASDGFGFQHRVAAWFAVRLLAGRDISESLDLGSAQIDRVGEEIPAAVDDVIVFLSSGGFVFVQCKKGLNLSDKPGKEFDKAVGQFVRQFLAHLSDDNHGRPWHRPLDPQKDRLVLAVNPGASGSIREDLKQFLDRVKSEIKSGTGTGALPVNKKRQSAFNKLKTCLDRHWRTVTTEALDDANLRTLLSMIRILVLDLEGTGAGSHRTDVENTIALLANHVVVDATTASNAWDAIVACCESLNSKQTSYGMKDFQGELTRKHIRLKGTPKYQKDIDSLKKYTHRTLGDLQQLSQIRLDGHVIKIPRPIKEKLKRLAATGPTLVTGDPGAGKSGLLHDLVADWLVEDVDVVLIAVDRLGASNDAALRQDLDGLEHDLHEILLNWPGHGPAYLVIDALDAARMDQTASLLKRIIQRVVDVHSRWKVIASIRVFDMEKSEKTQTLFSRNCVCVPLLTDEELNTYSLRNSRFVSLIDHAAPTLKDLLRVPFNLRILAELLNKNVAISELYPIKTQNELLDRYWKERVIDEDGKGDVREILLRQLVTHLITNRTMQMDRLCLLGLPSVASDSLNDLLSRNIIIKTHSPKGSNKNQNRITFSTHVLFDFACVRLFLEGKKDYEEVISTLASERDLVLFLRPALSAYFQRIWESDRKVFWDAAVHMAQTSGVPAIGVLIPLSVAVENVVSLADFGPLLDVMARHEEATAQIVGYLSGAILDHAERAGSLMGQPGQPWAGLLRSVTDRGADAHCYAVRPLMDHINKIPDDINRDSEQRVDYNAAARRLLALGIKRAGQDRFIISLGIDAVARSMKGDVQQSVASLEALLEPTFFSEYSFQFLHSLAQEIPVMVPMAPVLVESIYKAAFAFKNSNVRQDYVLEQFLLAKRYPLSLFFNADPVVATRACIAAMEGMASRENVRSDGSLDQRREFNFSFGTFSAVIQEDRSYVWAGDSVGEGGDRTPQILQSWIDEMVGLVAADPKDLRVATVVDTFVATAKTAILWVGLMKAGQRNPHHLGIQLTPLLQAVPILTWPDTQYQAGELLRVVHPLLSEQDRHHIEAVIFSLPEQFPIAERVRGEKHRDRLLGCIPQEGMVSPNAITRVERLRQQGDAPINESVFLIGGVTSEHYTMTRQLHDMGISAEEPANAQLLTLAKKILEMSKTPMDDDFYLALVAMDTLLAKASGDGAHDKVIEYAQAVLAEACAKMAGDSQLQADSERGLFLRRILLQAATSHDPPFNQESADRFNEHQSWWPSARIGSAQGLPSLAGKPGFADAELLNVLEQLSQDPVPAVRDQIAHRLTLLYNTAPAEMWRILEWFCVHEENRGVLRGIMSTLDRLAGEYPDRIFP